MDIQFVKLHSTKLWETYKSKNPSDRRRIWVEDVYSTAVDWLKLVPKTFPNYTLHDETHVINVMNAMAGLLGNQIDKLSVGECELLILAAALHDIGMVYTDAAITEEGNNKRALANFLREEAPELAGSSFESLREKDNSLSVLQQNYLRSRHPFRVAKLLNMTIPKLAGRENVTWGFENKPSEIVPQEIIIAVCQSHGEDQPFLISNRLDYLSGYNVDPRFCALLLRLGDILDFDGSRAPAILAVFAEGIKRSEEAFKKHGESGGFKYPPTPSDAELSYCAECDDPNINFKIHNYLDWVDKELLLAASLKPLCTSLSTMEFDYPRRVARNEIKCNEFESKPFSVTMDQEQILKLLSGENLYRDTGVFIRELLQNAVDATLLRGKLESDFSVESDEAAIYLWSGYNKNGDPILRIDDNGTGMTRNMLHTYFLKVGKSYYQSKELKRDLIQHKVKGEYHSISRFGIGILSCFLVGKSVEVSTLYFDEKKCCDENDYEGIVQNGFGLRVVVPELSGQYALHNQALNHYVKDELPFPNGIKKDLVKNLEHSGYRQKAGTSIVVTLDPSKLGALEIKAEVEKYLCAPRMPVYFNGKRIGRTYQEMMTDAGNLAGSEIYELSEEEKANFDRQFPYFAGNYPKMSVKLEVMVATNSTDIEDLSIITINRQVIYTPKVWPVKDQQYIMEFSAIDKVTSDGVRIEGSIKNVVEELQRNNCKRLWDAVEHLVSVEAANKLADAFFSFPACPESPELLGEVWLPFSQVLDLRDAWIAYVDNLVHKGWTTYTPAFRTAPLISRLSGNRLTDAGVVSYHGIYVDQLIDRNNSFSASVLSYLEGQQRPDTDLGRKGITNLPAEAELVICAIMEPLACHEIRFIKNETRNLSFWRKMRYSSTGRVTQQLLYDEENKLQVYLQRPYEKSSVGKIVYSPRDIYNKIVIACFFLAVLQDRNEIHICFREGGALHFKTVEEKKESPYDVFPPMPFCLASSDADRRYLCTAEPLYRRGITADHDYAAWLIENSEALHDGFRPQFEKIVNSLLYRDVDSIIQNANIFRTQLYDLKTLGKSYIDIPPELTEDDFWYPPEEV